MAKKKEEVKDEVKPEEVSKTVEKSQHARYKDGSLHI